MCLLLMAAYSEYVKMWCRIETLEKSLAICNEKSSFKIDGCNIFIIINHIFLT